MFKLTRFPSIACCSSILCKRSISNDILNAIRSLATIAIHVECGKLDLMDATFSMRPSQAYANYIYPFILCIPNKELFQPFIDSIEIFTTQCNWSLCIIHDKTSCYTYLQIEYVMASTCEFPIQTYFHRKLCEHSIYICKLKTTVLHFCAVTVVF